MDHSSLPLLDEAHFTEMTGDDLEFKRDIAVTFIETVANLLEDLDAATDETACRSIAHRIKGTSLNIGLIRLGAVAAEAENELFFPTRQIHIALLRSVYKYSSDSLSSYAAISKKC